MTAGGSPANWVLFEASVLATQTQLEFTVVFDPLQHFLFVDDQISSGSLKDDSQIKYFGFLRSIYFVIQKNASLRSVDVRVSSGAFVLAF